MFLLIINSCSLISVCTQMSINEVNKIWDWLIPNAASA